MISKSDIYGLSNKKVIVFTFNILIYIRLDKLE